MKDSAIPTAALLVWLVIAIAVIVLGAGFAGGLAKLFTIPWGMDPASLLIWAITWAMVLAPFALLGRRLFRRILQKSEP